MISHQYKCIFIHIPKCAGTSIEAALGHFEAPVQRGWQDHRSLRMIETPFLTPQAFSSAHNIIEIYRRLKQHYFTHETNPRNKLMVTKDQYNSYYKFTIVRSPWARAYSWYKNVMRDDVFKKNFGITGSISFGDFLQLHGGKGMLRPQLYWIRDFSGRIPLDYVGRFENLADDFQKILQAMGLKPTNLPHELKGSEGDYRENYDEKSRKIISDIYKQEIEMFGYSFDG